MMIQIRKNVLSDKSETFDVVLMQNGQQIELPAYDADDAAALAKALHEAIDNFSAETVTESSRG